MLIALNSPSVMIACGVSRASGRVFGARAFARWLGQCRCLGGGFGGFGE
jgi:hypothetical protein